MQIPTRRRRVLSTLLALFLAIESVSAVAAVATVQRGDGVGQTVVPTGVPDTAQRLEVAPAALAAPAVASKAVIRIGQRVEASDPVRIGPVRTVPAAVRARTIAVRAALAFPKPKPAARGSSGSGGTGSVSAGALKGRNHFWFPSVGINRSVYSFPCSRSRPPDNLVYRWGCAGANNVYLLGHAHSVFAPLHSAYVNGRLKVGMKAYYADSRGRVHTYSVRWWKLTKPTTSASWAWAAQSVPSMTLQTCVGSNSEYRLMVRLVEVR
jgi:hypothetical protein